MLPLLPGFWLGRWVGETNWEESFVVSCLWLAVVLAGVVCVACGFFSFRTHIPESVSRRTVCFSVTLFLYLFLFGCWRSAIAWQDVQKAWPAENRLWRVMLADVPEDAGRSVRVAAMVLGEGRTSGRIQLYFYGDSMAKHLQVGDELLFEGIISRPHNRGNPEEFDFASYLAVKGISGSASVPEGKWRKTDEYDGWDDRLPFMSNLLVGALRGREHLLDLYRKAGLRGEPMALFSALTLGEDSALSPELEDVYAGVGVTHVLALSGMHLTYLVAMLHFVLLRYCRQRVMRWVGGILVLGMIWGYTFLAGIPPSLVRAAVTYSFMQAGALLGRSGFSINSLAVSALLMLCLNPLWLYDVGFQLSFLAMAGILLIYPRCSELPFMQNRRWAWLFDSLAVSLAASAFTVPLVACCFGTFAPYSALGTLLVSPISAVLVYCMPVMWLVGWTGIGTTVCVKGVEWLVLLQNGCLRWMADWPFAVMNMDWSPLLMVSCYVGLAVCLSASYFSRATWLKLLFSTTLWIVCVGIADAWSKRTRSGVVFYYNTRCPAVHVIYSSSASYLFPALPDSVQGGMAYIADSFWRRKLSAPPVVVSGNYRDARVSATNGLVECAGGMSFLVLCDDRWERLKSNVRADVDYLYVCRGFKGSLPHLARLFQPRHVVLDASLWKSDRERCLQECRDLGWDCYDMRQEGALKVALN